MKLLFIAALLFIGSMAKGQSIFKPLPKITHTAINPFARATTPLPDSTFTGFRPIVSAAVYGYTKQSGSSLFTGAGISYEWDTYNSTTQKWYTNESIGALFYAGGTSAPTGISGVTAVGLAVSFFNKLASFGAAYNIQTKSIMPTIGVSVSLNN
jgi:hypothetical protein